MTQHTDIPLRRHYPISLRLILVRSIHWILAFVILLILISAFDSLMARAEPSFADTVFSFLATALVLGGLLVLCLKLVYEIIHFLLYDYKVESQQLVISKGVFWRSRATFPLVKLTDVYVERNPLEIIFFVSTLQVTTAAALSGVNFGGIEGLPSSTARALQTFVTELASTVQPEVKEEKAEKVLSENLPPEKASTDLERRSPEELLEQKHEAEQNAASLPPDHEKLDEVLSSLAQVEESIKKMKEDSAATHGSPASVADDEEFRKTELKIDRAKVPQPSSDEVDQALNRIIKVEQTIKTLQSEQDAQQSSTKSAQGSGNKGNRGDKDGGSRARDD